MLHCICENICYNVPPFQRTVNSSHLCLTEQSNHPMIIICDELKVFSYFHILSLSTLLIEQCLVLKSDSMFFVLIKIFNVFTLSRV